jgi:hypothetical protein
LTQHSHANPANRSENEILERSPQTQPHAPVLAQSAAFVGHYALRILLISAAVLVPVFWHRTIAAGDLGSHLYNAWLAQLVRHGYAPGLWLAPRWNNVLFDYLLVGLGRFVSLHAAEKLAVSLAVLIFFWGAFAFVCAATRRAPWLLCPVIALFSYGYSFQMGFLNFYISLGLAFFGIAVFWRGRGWERLIAVALAPLAMLAHPLGFAWLVAASAHVAIAEAIPRRYQVLLVAAAGVALFAARYYFWHHDIVLARDAPFYFFNGSDQLLLFGPRYAFPEFALLVFIFAAFAADFFSRPWGKLRWQNFTVPLELYIIVTLGVILLPDGIRFPYQPSALALLTERLTSVSAVLLCCLLGVLQPRKWHLLAGGAIAALFFTFLYQDIGTIDRMEAQVVQLVRTVPANSRVLATLKPPFPESRILVQHIADRACIGHCFSYGNYEPASGQFRVRTRPHNLYAMFSFNDAVNMEDGSYELQPEDLPAYQVYQCSENGKKLCIRPLAAGEMNDDLGIHPDGEQ